MSLQYEADGEGIFFSALFCCNFFKKRWFGLNSECSSTVLLVKRLVGRSWTLSAASAHLVIWLMMRKAGLPQPLLHHQLKKKNVQRYCCISCYFLMITVCHISSEIHYTCMKTVYVYEVFYMMHAYLNIVLMNVKMYSAILRYESWQQKLPLARSARDQRSN